jgi:hypothetical protein
VAVDRSFRATFRLSASSGDRWAEMPVSVNLMMPDHAMSPLEPALSRGDGGEFTASGTLPMSGRWKLLIQTPDGSATVPFRIDE